MRLHQEIEPLLAMLQIVRASPGLPLSALRERAKIGWGSTYHRVDLLRSLGLVRMEKDGRRQRLFPTAADPGALLAAAAGATLSGPRHGTARRIAAAILAQPGIGGERLARGLDIPRRSVYYNLRRLVAAGLVERCGPAGRCTLQPTDRLRAAIAAEAPPHAPGALHGATNAERGGPCGPPPL